MSVLRRVAAGGVLWLAIAGAAGQSLSRESIDAFRQAVDDFRSQRWQAALAELRDLEQEHPDWFDVQHLLGLTLDISGSPQEASEHFRRAVELQPGSVQARANYGANLNRLGRSREAIAQFRKALEIDPDNATINYNLGTLLLSRREFDQALPWLRKAREAEPGRYESNYQLAFCLLALGDYSVAKEVLDGMGSVPPQRGEFHLLKALTSKALGVPGAEDELGRSLESLAATPAANAQLATLLMRQGLFQEALPLLELAAQRFADSPETWLNLAAAEFALGKEGAQSHAERALALEESAQGHLLLADILDAKEESVQAAPHYQRAAQLDPGEESTYALGYFFLRHWNWQEAAAVFQAGLREHKASASLSLGLGAAKLGSGDDDGATRAFLQAAGSGDPPAAAFKLLAQSFVRASDPVFQQSVECLQGLNKAKPGDPWSTYYFALAALRQAERSGAATDLSSLIPGLEQIADSIPDFYEAHRLAGEIHLRQNAWAPAAVQLGKACQLDPTDVECRYKLALALRRSGDQQGAQTALEAYQRLKREQNDAAAERLSRTKKLIVDMAGKTGRPAGGANPP